MYSIKKLFVILV